MRICSREQRKKQLDWLATNTDVITSQSHSLFACSREQIRQVENRLYSVKFVFARRLSFDVSHLTLNSSHPSATYLKVFLLQVLLSSVARIQDDFILVYSSRKSLLAALRKKMEDCKLVSLLYMLLLMDFTERYGVADGQFYKR